MKTLLAIDVETLVAVTGGQSVLQPGPIHVEGLGVPNLRPPMVRSGADIKLPSAPGGVVIRPTQLPAPTGVVVGPTRLPGPRPLFRLFR